eukprot:147024-Amphidinium_carterae.1
MFAAIRLNSVGGAATQVPVAENLSTLSRCLVRTLAMAVGCPFNEVGMKHSMKVPLMRPSVAASSDSSDCSLA